MAASETWSLRPGQALQHRHWDDEYVLYNDLSGDTHLLGEAAIVLLLALRAGPATRDALAAILETRFDDEDEGEDADPIDYGAEAEALLLDMKRLFLVDRKAC